MFETGHDRRECPADKPASSAGILAAPSSPPKHNDGNKDSPPLPSHFILCIYYQLDADKNLSVICMLENIVVHASILLTNDNPFTPINSPITFR